MNEARRATFKQIVEKLETALDQAQGDLETLRIEEEDDSDDDSDLTTMEGLDDALVEIISAVANTKKGLA